MALVHREKDCFIKYDGVFKLVHDSFNLILMHYILKHFYRVAI